MQRRIEARRTARSRVARALASVTLGTFAVNGAIALLAPSAEAPRELDPRGGLTLHEARP